MTLDDFREISALLVRQRLVGDMQDEAKTRDCWAREGRLTVRVNGAEPKLAAGLEEVMAFARNAWVTDDHGPRDAPHIHFGGPPDITPIGEGRALAKTTCLFIGPSPDGMVVHGYGRYEDEVIVEDGAWKLLHRKVEITRPGKP